MSSMIEPELKTRRWRRVEYERLVELGVFTGERLELLDGLLVVREPQGSLHASTVAQVARVLERAFGAGELALRSRRGLASLRERESARRAGRGGRRVRPLALTRAAPLTAAAGATAPARRRRRDGRSARRRRRSRPARWSPTRRAWPG